MLHWFIPKYKRNENIKYIRFYYNFCACLALVPIYDFKKERIVNKTFVFLYCLLMMIIHFCIFGYFTEQQILYIWPTLSDVATTVVLECSTMIAIFTLIIISIIVSYTNKSKWLLFFSLLGEIDIEISSFKYGSPGICLFAIETISFQIILIFFILYDLYEWFLIVKNDMFKIYAYISFLYYLTVNIVMLICNLAFVMKVRFQRINEHLLNYIQFKYNKNSNTFEIMNLTKLYLKLCFVVKNFNIIFGWQILILLTIQLLGIIDSFNFFLYGLISTKSKLTISNKIFASSLSDTAFILVIDYYNHLSVFILFKFAYTSLYF